MTHETQSNTVQEAQRLSGLLVKRHTESTEPISVKAFEELLRALVVIAETSRGRDLAAIIARTKNPGVAISAIKSLAALTQIDIKGENEKAGEQAQCGIAPCEDSVDSPGADLAG